MSVFNGADESDHIYQLSVGIKLTYEYDMRSTTEVLITFIGTMWREPPAGTKYTAHAPCVKCGASADYIDIDEMYRADNPFYCEKCAEERNEVCLLPVTNSPRMGVCAYCGEQDTYRFVPPEKARAKA